MLHDLILVGPGRYRCVNAAKELRVMIGSCTLQIGDSKRELNMQRYYHMITSVRRYR